eukprot:3199078-Rhodomonas_salina.1
MGVLGKLAPSPAARHLPPQLLEVEAVSEPSILCTRTSLRPLVGSSSLKSRSLRSLTFKLLRVAGLGITGTLPCRCSSERT